MVGNLIAMVIQAYIVVLLIRSLITFFPNVDYRNPIIRFIFDITEPVLKPVRRAIGTQNGIDFSPMVVFIGLYVLANLVQRIF
jgi:YggT family protein